jgi:16S rRNA (cytidine1402-2'-O)-methyltransferase
MSGTLYIVATPIGNLEDISYRAVRILREADVIACEDTRQTQVLLAHYGIPTPRISYHEHNERERAAELLERLRAGARVALVSDAGTPLVSDPGYRLVRAAVEAGIAVVPVPGASAVLCALAASGFGTGSFRFGGFLPAKAAQRRRALEELAAAGETVVLFESPHRILATLADLNAVLGARQIVLARELTKVHEEFLRGTAAEIRRELAARTSIRGEMTLVIEKGETPAAEAGPAAEAVRELEAGGMSRMEAIKQVARERGLAKRDVYREVERGGE